jgi:DNA-binding LytR/AlgR family response regulator
MKRILIIEDDVAIRENFSEIFNDDGYKTIVGTCGKEGIEIAISSHPDLIICDITMPDIDGFEVKKILSNNKKTSSIPFIFLTARTDIKDFQYAMEIGADDYIVKPVRAAKLLELVSKRLKRIEELKHNDSEKIEDDTTIADDKKIFLKSGEKYILTVIKDILVIKAANDYSEVFLNNHENALIKKSLKSWEDILPAKSFLRIHRNTIINIEQIEKIERMFKGSFVVKLKNHPELIYFSQRYSQKLRKLLLLK